MSDVAPVIVAALAGGLLALAAREAALASPTAVAWVRAALEPLRRAGREGYAPTRGERRRLALLGAGSALGAGWFLAGAAVAAPLAVAGPAIAAWSVSSRRARFRAAVEAALPAVATAIADALGAGRSLRSAICAAPASLEGPAAVEMARLAAELELGEPTGGAIEGWRLRQRSRRADAFAATLLSQRLAGGDAAGLLRGFAAAALERDRVAEEARTATAQARFTGLLVVAMPTGAALLAELLSPGFLGGVLANPVAAALLLAAAGFQFVGYLAIRHFARVAK